MIYSRLKRNVVIFNEQGFILLALILLIFSVHGYMYFEYSYHWLRTWMKYGDSDAKNC